MKNKTNARTSFEGTHLQIIRVFNAPREAIFNALIDSDKLKQWWSPKEFTTPVFNADPVVGGRYIGCMRSPDGKEMWSTGKYIEVRAPEKLKYTDSFSDKSGKVVPATYYNMSKDIPLECIVEMTLAERGGSTELTLKHFGLPEEITDDCGQGWNECLDKLEALVVNETKFDRKFDAKTARPESRYPSPDSNLYV